MESCNVKIYFCALIWCRGSALNSGTSNPCNRHGSIQPCIEITEKSVMKRVDLGSERRKREGSKKMTSKFSLIKNWNTSHSVCCLYKEFPTIKRQSYLCSNASAAIITAALVSTLASWASVWATIYVRFLLLQAHDNSPSLKNQLSPLSCCLQFPRNGGVILLCRLQRI